MNMDLFTPIKDSTSTRKYPLKLRKMMLEFVLKPTVY